jgi:predicted transcriptional regulator
MRTIVDLPDALLRQLTEIAAERGSSRAELIRRALAAFVERVPSAQDSERAFGLWRERGEDALQLQDRLRREWDACARSSIPTS